MTTQTLDRDGRSLAFDDSGGDGHLVVLVPGAGDIRSEYRFLTSHLVASGARVVTTDLRGHGESSADWPAYGVAESADDLAALIGSLDAGPASIVGTSFAPAAGLWVAAEHPELVSRLVLISAHLESAPAWQRAMLNVSLRGPLAGRIWASFYKGWHPAAPPADLDSHAAQLAEMIQDSARRKAVRRTLNASRDGLADRMSHVAIPTLVIMGGADSHFKDPEGEGRSIAQRTNGELEVVAGAGHYPHVEYPDQVAKHIVGFLTDGA